MTQHVASRTELLQRNPMLKKHWFTRFMVGPILIGAQLNPLEWSRIRFLLFAGPILLLIFIINLIFTENLSITKQVLHLLLIVNFALAIPLICAAAYGYKRRSELDTTNAPVGDFSQLGRYMMWGAFISGSITTGIGLFGWLK